MPTPHVSAENHSGPSGLTPQGRIGTTCELIGSPEQPGVKKKFTVYEVVDVHVADTNGPELPKREHVPDCARWYPAALEQAASRK